MSDRNGTVNLNDLMDDGDDTVIDWYAREDRKAYEAAILASEDRAEMLAHGLY